MSTTGHDAFPETSGPPRKLDAPEAAASEAPEFTEDLANETTSEIDPVPSWSLPARAARIREPEEALAAPPAPPAVPNVLRERYLLETQIGNGGTALVYRAVDLRRDTGVAGGGRHVAVKLLRPELRDRPQSIARLQREFRQTQAVAHPNVVRCLDLDCDQGAWFIVMELLSGESLGPVLRRLSPAGLPASEAMRIALAVGDALTHAHAQGIVHGDVKPDNIFLTGGGDVRLFDFGVAPESGSPESPDTRRLPVAAAATRVYASPEVLAGAIPEPRDDVYSLACVIYEMLEGVHPYGRRCADAAEAAGMVPEKPAALGAAQGAALLAGLAFERAARPAMSGFLDALRAEAVAPQPAPVADLVPAAIATLATVPAAPQRSTKRPNLTLLSSIAAGLALVLGILIGRIDSAVEPSASQPTPPRAEAASPAPSAMPGPDVAVGKAPAAVRPAPASEPASVAAAEPPAAAAASGLVFFDGPTMRVSNRAVVAAIPLRHLNRERRAVSVNWRVVDGTARAGRDYAGPPSGTEPFIEGNSFRILYVPILPRSGATADRTFSVELTAASAGASLGPTSRVEVTILGES
jgi:hypothetical protein